MIEIQNISLPLDGDLKKACAKKHRLLCILLLDRVAFLIKERKGRKICNIFSADSVALGKNGHFAYDFTACLGNQVFK